MVAKHCLIVEDQAEHSRDLTVLCEALGFQVSGAADLTTARAVLAEVQPDVAFVTLDIDGQDGLTLFEHINFDNTEVMVMGDSDEPVRAHKAMRMGASYFFCKPFDQDFIKPVLEDIATELGSDDKADIDPDMPCAIDQFGYLRGSSKPMRKLYRMLRKVAPSDASLLIIGESGTGKELVARTAHEMSDRANQPFVAFNCAAVAETLIESELFGHEKGSFSGADKRHTGFFERARGGTLLLDEITEMNMDLQAKLLRVLETRQLRRVGSEQDISINVRVISATNRVPEEAVADGSLREDLYFRLAQIPMTLPPLRSRGDDIGGLAQYFLNELNAVHNTQLIFENDTLDKLAAYHWPGNVRQLRHTVERGYILSESTIGPDTLPDIAGKALNNDISAEDSLKVSLRSSLAESEQQIILAMLEKNDADKKKTADDLGISLKTLYNRLNDYGAETE